MPKKVLKKPVRKFQDGGDVGLGAASTAAGSAPFPKTVSGPKVTYPTGESQQLKVLPKSQAPNIPWTSPSERQKQGISLMNMRQGGRNLTDMRKKGGPIRKGK
jgi:hypothetical protein